MALSFSVLRQIPVRVFNIRAGRSNPGLRAQHLKGNFDIMLMKSVNLVHQTLCFSLLKGEAECCYNLCVCVCVCIYI
jgi:hypothetical protein